MAIHDKGTPSRGPKVGRLVLTRPILLQVLSYQGDIKESSPPPFPPPCDGSVHCGMTSLED